jgi:hypothetical protein
VGQLMDCPSCGRSVSGARVSKGYVWCVDPCNRRVCSVPDFIDAWTGGKLDEEGPLLKLVWITASDGRRYASLVPAEACPNAERVV